MPYLTNLAVVARRTGFPVTEVSGWQKRGHGPQPAVKGIVAHHTAGWNDMHVVRDGRPGLDGPLSQIWLRRDGTIFVVAAGLCWHNAPSTSANHTNSNSIGIEAENDGRTPWPAEQLDSYHRLCAELCKEFGLSASAVKGHKEVQPGKPDPHSLSMNAFRADVARAMSGAPRPTAKPAKPKPNPTEVMVKKLPTLKLGDGRKDDDPLKWHVKDLHHLLLSHDYGGLDGIDDTVFTEAHENGVKGIQKAAGITVDGVVGPDETWPVLLRVA